MLCCVTAADCLWSLQCCCFSFLSPPCSHGSCLGDSSTHSKLHWHCSAKLFSLLHSCLLYLTQVPLHSRVVTGANSSLWALPLQWLSQNQSTNEKSANFPSSYISSEMACVSLEGGKDIWIFPSIIFQSIKLSKLQVLKNIQIHK